MKGISYKLRLIYKSFALIAIGFLLIYTFLHWLLIIKAGISIKEEIVKFWLPFGLPVIPIFFALRPRIKLLHFKNDNSYFFYLLVACFAIAIPTIIAQEYLVTATGKLTEIENVSQIEKHDKTKYYVLNNYYIDKQHIAIQNTASVSGRHNENLNMLIYIVMPIVEKNGDAVTPENKYWLGKQYNERISNRLSDQEKEDRYEAFVEKCQKEFEETDFSRFTYLEVVGNTEQHNEYNIALEKINVIPSADKIVFEAKTEPFEARNGKKLPWIFGSLAIGLLAYLILLLFPKFEESKFEQFKNGEQQKDTDLKEMLAFFIPKKGFCTTPLIIDINLLIYIAMVVSGLGFISFKGNDLLNWGANFRPLVMDGQWWRLLTNTFLHGGLVHVLVNMYGLLFVGIFLEPLLGAKRYAFVYLLTGTLASVASIWWYEATVSVGASGAIFGLYGFFLACLSLKVFPTDFGKAFLVSTLVFVGFNLVMGFIGGGIDNAAHIGGLLSGFILGMMMSGQLKRQTKMMAEYKIENEE